jgi:hypothetical protein
MVSPPRDEREQALRAVMQSLEHRKVETIAVTHRMALDALKAFQFALEDADGDIPEDVHSPLFDEIMVVLHAMEAMSKGLMGRVLESELP